MLWLLLRPFELFIGLFGDRLYVFSWFLLKPMLWLITKVNGKQNLKNLENSGLIIVSNHIGYADIPIIGGVFSPNAKINFFGKKELLAMPILGIICKHGFMIPVDRKNQTSGTNISAVRRALMVLKTKGTIGIFMQGGIGFVDIKRSPIELAIRTDALIIPIYLEQKRWFRLKIFEGIDIGPYQIFVGKKMRWRELGNEPPSILAEKLWKKILALKSNPADL